MKMKLSVWFCLAFLVCSSNAVTIIETDDGSNIRQYHFVPDSLPYGRQQVMHIQACDWADNLRDEGLLFYDPVSGIVKIITFFDYLRVVEFNYPGPDASPYSGYWGVGLESGETTLRLIPAADSSAGSAPGNLSAAPEPHRINSPALIEAFQTLEGASRDVMQSSAAAVLRGEVEGTQYVFLFYLYDAFRVTNNGVNAFTMIVELFSNGAHVGTTDGLLFFQDTNGYYNFIFTWFGNDDLNSMSVASTVFRIGSNNEAKLIAHNSANLTMLFGVRQ